MAFILLPPFGTWVVLWSSGVVITQLIIWFGITPPFSYLIWLSEHWSDIEIICLIWMVVYFSWVLLERFNVLRKQVVQKELEKEIARNQLMTQQKEELEIQVEERTHKLQESLEALKSTQAQLIQSEKLASLGELTAGIAHEIQNPLNFVNNFSEVSTELLDEMRRD
nr:histidine kinase dimerization/phospho-acceptor domain-containing protein [Haliscomenobacter sp.]